MNRRLYAIEKPFPATMLEDDSFTRVFKPPETLWWDTDQQEDPVVFEVDNIRFFADRSQFLTSIRVPS